MNRTNKNAIVKRLHSDNHKQLNIHLVNFVSALNFGRRLKTLRGLTHFESSASSGPPSHSFSGYHRSIKCQD